MSEFVIETHEKPNGLVVRLIGEAGVAIGNRLEQDLTRICARRPKIVVIDLAELIFISSLAMGQLVAANHALLRAGDKLFVAAVTPKVMESFKRARLDTLLKFIPNVEAAFSEQ